MKGKEVGYEDRSQAYAWNLPYVPSRQGEQKKCVCVYVCACMHVHRENVQSEYMGSGHRNRMVLTGYYAKHTSYTSIGVSV